MNNFLWIIYSDIKIFSGNRDGNGEHYAKWNKPGIGRINFMMSLICQIWKRWSCKNKVQNSGYWALEMSKEKG